MGHAAKNLVAVNGDTNEAGAVVYWTLSRTVDHDTLVKAWIAAGFDKEDVVDPPTPPTACTRAVNYERDERARRLSRPLEGHRGRALVDEEAKDDDLSYEVAAKASITDEGLLLVETEDDALKASIEATYYRILFRELSTSDVSGWIVKVLLPRVDAVRCAPTGGFYFVPRERLDEWRAMTSVIRDSSNHSFYEIPAMHTEEAIDAILASVTNEADALAERMWGKLAAGTMGERAINTQAAEADAMKAKVSRYEALLGTAMPALQASLTKLRANLGAAALRASNDEDYSDLAGL